MTEFLTNLDTLNTEVRILNIFTNRLRIWPKKTFYKFKKERMGRATRKVMEAQDSLGWKPFIYSRLSERWEVAQQA